MEKKIASFSYYLCQDICGNTTVIENSNNLFLNIWPVCHSIFFCIFACFVQPQQAPEQGQSGLWGAGQGLLGSVLPTGPVHEAAGGCLWTGPPGTLLELGRKSP